MSLTESLPTANVPPGNPHTIIKAMLAQLVRQNALAWLTVPGAWLAIAILFAMYPQATVWVDSLRGWSQLGIMVAFCLIPSLMAYGAPWGKAIPEGKAHHAWPANEAVIGGAMMPRWLRPFGFWAITSTPQPPIIFATICFSVPEHGHPGMLLTVALGTCCYHAWRAYTMRLWEHLIIVGGVAIIAMILGTCTELPRPIYLAAAAAISTVYLLALHWSTRHPSSEETCAVGSA